MKDETLEESVVGIFDKLGCNIDSDRIEAYHRVTKYNNTATAKKSGIKKKELNNHKMEDFGLPGHRKIFIYSSSCPYYKILWSKSRKLLTLGKINSFYISNGTIRFKISENSSSMSITYVDDFGKDFPDIDLSLSRPG